MLPALIGIGIAAAIINSLLNDTQENSAIKRKRVFISFAIEDEKYRSYLVAQAKSSRSPFGFVDMSVKQPWDEATWKKKCRSKMKQCDGAIVLLSNNTWHASGVRWEIKCAIKENIPIVGMHIRGKAIGAIPTELEGQKVITWNWNNLEDVINNF